MPRDSFILRSLVAATVEQVVAGAPKLTALDQAIGFGGRGAMA